MFIHFTICKNIKNLKLPSLSNKKELIFVLTFCAEFCNVSTWTLAFFWFLNLLWSTLWDSNFEAIFPSGLLSRFWLSFILAFLNSLESMLFTRFWQFFLLLDNLRNKFLTIFAFFERFDPENKEESFEMVFKMLINWDEFTDFESAFLDPESLISSDIWCLRKSFSFLTLKFLYSFSENDCPRLSDIDFSGSRFRKLLLAKRILQPIFYILYILYNIRSVQITR